jgi:hypothetical protein
VQQLIAQMRDNKTGVVIPRRQDIPKCGFRMNPHRMLALGTDEDCRSAKMSLEGTIISIGDAVMGLGQLRPVGKYAVVHIDGTTIDVLVMPKAIQYGTMEQFKAAGVDFHIYDIAVVKMGHLDTYPIPETAYHAPDRWPHHTALREHPLQTHLSPHVAHRRHGQSYIH